jgi:hypothetical protein
MAEEPKKKRVDYTQLRVIGDADAEKTQALADDLERKIQRCKREYDLWFYGTNSKPPHELRSQLDRHVRLLRNKLPKRTADAFKIGVILQKYQSLVELWDKSQRKMEEGGGVPWMAQGHRNPLHELQEANERRQEEGRQRVKSAYVARVKGEGDEDEMRKVFNSYVAAKKKVGQDVSGASFDKFRQALGKQTEQIISSGKGKAVAYRIEISDGKVAIKAKPED